MTLDIKQPIEELLLQQTNNPTLQTLFQRVFDNITQIYQYMGGLLIVMIIMFFVLLWWAINEFAVIKDAIALIVSANISKNDKTLADSINKMIKRQKEIKPIKKDSLKSAFVEASKKNNGGSEDDK